MKYLSDYIEAEQSALIKELGVFFAFSNAQFEEGVAENGHLKPEGTKWSSMGAGMYLPSVNVEEFMLRHKALHKSGIAKDLAENGREGVLERELGNYEIGLAWEGHRDRNFRDGIEGYGFTEQEIEAAYKKHMETHEY